MKIKVNNDADRHALAQLAGLQNPRSLLGVLAGYIQTRIEYYADLEIVIKQDQLPQSYRANPSLFGKHLLGKCLMYEDSSGHQTPQKLNYVTVWLHVTRKAQNERYTQAQPSLKRVVKAWLNLNAPKTNKLHIKIEGIPPFFFSHPEQLIYQIKRETQTPIKIIKLKTKWIIARK